MESTVQQFLNTTLREAFVFMQPYLSNYAQFSQSLSGVVRVKEHQNVQYSFDVALDNLVKSNLQKFNISGHIFSEESGFFEQGEPRYRVVYDPFCNSTLATHTFQDAALGISIFTDDYRLITSAILDYQTGIAGIVDEGQTSFYQIPSGQQLSFALSEHRMSEEAWVVVVIEKRRDRGSLGSILSLLQSPERLIVGSGHIYWLRLAMGMIDGYTDPFGGEHLYEMFAASVAQGNGCRVTDLEDTVFDPGMLLKTFEQDQNFVYYPVAATTEELHREILQELKGYSDTL